MKRIKCDQCSKQSKNYGCDSVKHVISYGVFVGVGVLDGVTVGVGVFIGIGVDVALPGFGVNVDVGVLVGVANLLS